MMALLVPSMVKVPLMVMVLLASITMTISGTLTISDSGVGILTITWETDFANANYALIPGGRGATSNDHTVFDIDEGTALLAGSAIITSATGGNVLTDPQLWTFVAYGAQ